jgi:hypothetical protein
MTNYLTAEFFIFISCSGRASQIVIRPECFYLITDARRRFMTDYFYNINPQQMDVICEIGNIGAGNAATACPTFWAGRSA